MSMGAEWLDDLALQQDIAENAVADKVWITRDGRHTPIAEMTDGHLVNTIRMLERKGFISKSEYEAMTLGNPPQGDMAMMAYEQAIDELFNTPVSPQLDDLRNELNKRGLKL